ncbi:MAG TPA: DNA polymerase III subunit gamma/tau [Fimbriimonadaceae bacterium]|nr:DNA polymerase III subunit gamma/tau [Fimbriimonadaceae bacterium]
MAHVSLYRKYRSQSFSDLIGQGHVVKTLQNGIESGRIAHSYLFTGPRGTGKTSSARLLAKALCCERGPSVEPCNECDICVSITEGSCIDVLEFDAASESGVDDVRETIVSAVDYQPAQARFKVFIIDEVHDLSPKAFDALLKTIEEPPAHIIFVLATTEYNKVPPTIRSRCQKFEFHRASIQTLVSRLTYVAGQEGVEVEPAALGAIAQMADGGFRDALTLLEQAILGSENKVTLQGVYDQLGLISDEAIDQLLEAVVKSNAQVVMERLGEFARLGRDPRSIVESMVYRLSDLTRVAYGVETGFVGDASREALASEMVAKIGRDHLLALRGAVSDAHKSVRDISLPRIWLEAELLSLGSKLNPPKVEAPRVQAVAQVPVKPPVPSAKNEAAPTTPPTPSPAPEVVREPKPEKTGDPVLDHASESWVATVKELSGLSKLMAMKLAHTRVLKASDDEISVEFERNHELDWIKENPKRVGAVNECFERHLGRKIKLNLQGAKKQESDGMSETVELPAEGAKLREMVEKTLGVAGDAT